MTEEERPMQGEAGAAGSPESCRYSKEHEWARIEESGYAQVGISDFAAGELGDVVFVQLPPVGTKVTQFEKFGEIESVKAVSELFAPVSGEVVETNPAIIDQPELVNQAPYGTGWMIRVRIVNPAELDQLMDNASYNDYLRGLAH